MKKTILNGHTELSSAIRRMAVKIRHEDIETANFNEIKKLRGVKFSWKKFKERRRKTYVKGRAIRPKKVETFTFGRGRKGIRVSRLENLFSSFDMWGTVAVSIYPKPSELESLIQSCRSLTLLQEVYLFEPDNEIKRIANDDEINIVLKKVNKIQSSIARSVLYKLPIPDT